MRIKTIDIQKNLPIGLLLYGPGLEIKTQLPPNIEMELASIHFHRSFLNTSTTSSLKLLQTKKAKKMKLTYLLLLVGHYILKPFKNTLILIHDEKTQPSPWLGQV